MNLPNQPGPKKSTAADSDRSDRFFRTEHLMDTLGSRTARGGVVTMASHGLKFAVSIVATAILARLLSPQDYGLIGMVAVATNFVAMFKDLGLSHATVQRPEISVQQISTLFWVNLTLSVLTMGLMVFLAPALAWFYGDPRLVLITVVSAVGLIVGGLTVQHEALLKRQMRFTALSAIALTSMTVGYVVGIAFAWYGFSFWALVFSQLALLCTNALLVWTICGWRPGLPRRDSGVRSMLSFGGNITGYATINYFSKNADTLLIGKFWGPQPLGLYSKAAQLVGLPTDQINEPLTSVAIPALSRLADSPERYRKAYLRMMEKVLMLVLPAVALIIVSSDWLISIVLGSQWKDAGPILVFMGIAGLLQPVISTGGWLLVSQGRGKHMIYWSLMSAPISVLSIIIGLPWGALGVAASYSLSRVLITNPLMYWYVGRSGPVRTMDFYRLLTPFILASVVGILACLGFRHLFNVGNPVLGVTVCFSLIATANLVVLSLMPSGRSALRDIKNSLLLLRPVRPVKAIEAQ
jgi:O-antigen/teichoic acid export membrane protein